MVVGALVLRAIAAGQSLYGDEIFTHEDGVGAGWWIGFAAAAAASMYTHYTAAAVVAAAVGWVLVFRPQARRSAALAGVGAALALVPWLALGPNASAPGVSTLFPFTAKD